MDYDLSRLSSRTFEHLVQALAVKVIAPGVVTFGDGPDGGREASYEGRIPYPSATEPWEGRLVVQAKFRQRPQGTMRDTNWALNELKEELEQTFRPGSKRVAPTHYIFATNLTLSSVPDSGGKARAAKLAEEFDLRGFRLWDYDQLRTYLDGDEDVRNAYTAYITSGDVLAELMSKLEHPAPKFDEVIANFLEKELLADQFANLEQAGRVAEEQIPISRVFVDLPIRHGETEPDARSEILAEMLRVAEQPLDPQSNAVPEQPLHGSHDPTRPPGRVVLIGGPGQGKTTVGQFLCQLFRIELLKGRPSGALSHEARAAMQLTERLCAQEEIPMPRIRRLPIRIPLTELSEKLAGPGRTGTLVEFMAAMVADVTGRKVDPEAFQEWLGEYPWLLVFDGLDEVPASSNRAQVMDVIRDFWVDAAVVNADLLVLATTRPQGYNDDFSPQLYRHLTLTPLTPDRSLHYGHRLAEARHAADERRQQKIIGRLERAAKHPATANLMTSPLQVTIMATLVDRRGQPPQERWKLFSDYYDVIYTREHEKEIPAAHILQEHKPDIDAIHHRVALLLQVEGEHASHAEARMSSRRFGAIVSQRLESEGYAGEELEKLKAEIIEAAADRLVFLVGLEADEVGFEIRSLQEFMAAGALMDDSDDLATERLREIAGVSSWRNVFLFAAGQCYARRQYLRDTINTVCSRLNDGVDDPIAPVVLPGSLLAADLLADGFARKQPGYSRLLADEALRLVDRASAAERLAGAYQDSLREPYARALEEDLDSSARLGPMMLLMRLSQDGQGWADEILDARMPAGSAGFTEALPAREGISGGWLARRAENVLTDMPLAAISRHSEVLEPVVPSSLGTTASLVDFLEQGWIDTQISIPFAGIDVSHFSLSLQSATQPMSELGSILDASGHELQPATRAGLEAITRFSLDPTAGELARQLEVILDRVPPGDWHALARIAPWPLGVHLTDADGDRGRLRHLHGLAEAGLLGDKAAWKGAEERWLGWGLGPDDLDYAPAIDAPVDGTIGSRGFPHVQLVWSLLTNESKATAKALLALLGKVSQPEARRDLTRWIAVLAASTFPGDTTTGPAAEGFAPGFIELEADDADLSHYSMLSGLAWNDTLSAAEDDLLDAIGLRLRSERQGPAWSKGRPTPELPEEIRRHWNGGAAKSDGLFRIVALATGADAGGVPVPAELAERNRGASGLCELKGDWDGERLGRASAAIAAVASSESIWLAEGIEVIRARADEPLAETALRLLWDASDELGQEARQTLRERMERLGSSWVDRRASELNRETVWSRLEFFDPPPPERLVARFA